MKCKCGLKLDATQPKRWLGVTPQGVPMVGILCRNGHVTDFAMTVLKPYRADCTDAFPPRRGQYFRQGDSVVFCCPLCCTQFGFDSAVHTLDDDGVITPNVACPTGCGFHAQVFLAQPETLIFVPPRMLS